MSVSQAFPAGPGGIAPSGPSATPASGAGATLRAERSARAYRQAVRHTRLVRLLRLALPVGAVASLVGLIVFPFINPFRDASVQVGLVRLDGTRVTMENPRLSGHRKDNSPYEVTAVSAIQDIRKPTIIELNGMRARLTSPDQGVMNLTATAAVFDSQREQLQLTRDVVVRTQSGQEARMASADVDFKAGTVKSRGGVAITLPDLAITAEAMDVSDSGATVTFSGRVKAIMTQKEEGAASGGASATGSSGPGSSVPAVRPRGAAGAPVPTGLPSAALPSTALPSSTLPEASAMRPGVAPDRPAAAAVVIDPATGQPAERGTGQAAGNAGPNSRLAP